MIRQDGSSVVTKWERNDTTNLVEMPVGIRMDPPTSASRGKKRVALTYQQVDESRHGNLTLPGPKWCGKDASPNGSRTWMSCIASNHAARPVTSDPSYVMYTDLPRYFLLTGGFRPSHVPNRQRQSHSLHPKMPSCLLH